MNNCVSCKHDKTIENILEDLKRNSDQHSKFYDRLGELDTGATLKDYQYTQIMEVLEEMKKDLISLKQQPVQKYEKITMFIYGAVISTVVGYFINMVLK